MYLKFYIDQYFLEQFIMDYFLLWFNAQSQKKKIRPDIIFLSSFCSAVISVAAICIRIPAGGMLGIIFATGIIHKKTKTTWKESVKDGWRLLIVTCGFEGVHQATAKVFHLPLIICGCLAAISIVWSFRSEDNYEQDSIVSVTLGCKNRKTVVRALIDSGNQLREPFTGKAVSIVNQEQMHLILGEDWRKEKGVLLIPFHSIGTEKGWLCGVTIDWMEISGRRISRRIEHPVIAIYKRNVSASQQYQMILHLEHAALKTMRAGGE